MLCRYLEKLTRILAHKICSNIEQKYHQYQYC